MRRMTCVSLLGHLCFAFKASFQNSSLGDPYTWVPFLGASEIGLADPITGKVMPGSDGSPVLGHLLERLYSFLCSMAVAATTGKLIPFKYEAGAIARQCSRLGQTFLAGHAGHYQFARPAICSATSSSQLFPTG